MAYELTESQKATIIKRHKDITDINALTRLVWADPDLDGRTKQGLAVREFLVEHELGYRTTKKIKRGDIPPLTPEQEKLILSEIKNNSNALAITRLVYSNEKLQKLSKEWKQVHQFISTATPESIENTPDGDVVIGAYNAPKDIVRLVNLVNGAMGTTIHPDKVSGKYKAYFDKLSINLGSSRFKRIINTYQSKKDRELFVDEFIRLTFEKPDLTPDELNLYLQVVRDILGLEILEEKINKMNAIFMEIEDVKDLKINFADNIKAAVDERNQVTKRIADTTKKLQGDRGERLKNQGGGDVSFIHIVQLAQEETERKNMIRLAELQRAAISEEANRLETLDSFVCRIMGVSKEEVI